MNQFVVTSEMSQQTSDSESDPEDEMPMHETEHQTRNVTVAEIHSHRGSITPAETSSSEEEPDLPPMAHPVLRGGTSRSINDRFVEVTRRRQQDPVTAEITFPAGRLIL